MIRLAREKLRGIPQRARAPYRAHPTSPCSPDESFDFVYSYAVFQHIPSREVVLGLPGRSPPRAEARRHSALPDQRAARNLPRYTTWDGVRIPAAEVADFALRHDFQLYALENVATQYMWTTWRKRPAGWRAGFASRRPRLSTRIRIISNALTADPLVPASGPRAFAALRIENLPADCDLINLEVRIDGRPRRAVVPRPAGMGWHGAVERSHTRGLPHRPRAGGGLLAGRAAHFGAWMRVVPSGPVVPRLCAVRDGDNLLSGTRIISRIVKLVMEEVTLRPELFHATSADGGPHSALTILHRSRVEQRHEIDICLPDSDSPRTCIELRIYIGAAPSRP